MSTLIPSLSHTCHSPRTVIQINGVCGYGDGQFSWASVLKAGDFIRESKHSLAVDIWEPQRFYSVIFLWRTFTLMQNNTWGDFLIIWLKKALFIKFLHLLNPKLRIDCHFNKHIHTFFLCFSSINKHVIVHCILEYSLSCFYCGFSCSERTQNSLSALFLSFTWPISVANPGSSVDLVPTSSSSEISQSISTSLSILASLTTLAFLQLQMRVWYEANVFIKHQLRCEWT